MGEVVFPLHILKPEEKPFISEYESVGGTLRFGVGIVASQHEILGGELITNQL